MFPIILALVTLTLPVAARDTGQWENQPIYLRQWFQKLMQPDNPDMSCYGAADALEADSFEIRGDQYVAIITNGKGIIPEGTRISVPKNKVKWDNGNPTGHACVYRKLPDLGDAFRPPPLTKAAIARSISRSAHRQTFTQA
jgi:hypothetical protein